jgi:carbamoyltransferase
VSIIGISDSHNAAAALLRPDGRLRALQEERPTRIKNYFDIPTQSVRWLLADAGLQPGDVEEVALANDVPFPPSDRAATIRAFRNSGSLRAVLTDRLRRTSVGSFVYSRRKQARLARYQAMGFRADQLRTYEHHLCHAAAAYYGLGQLADPVLLVTLDGGGDGLCATVSIGQDGRIERRFSVDWENSFGVVYAVVTYMTGMVPNEHEYKLMGMAPYASAQASRRICDKLLALFEWDSGGAPVWRRKAGVPAMISIKPVLERLFFEERFDAIMGGSQMLVEIMMAEFVRRAVQVTGVRRVACSGGVFMNVKANKVVMEMAEVESLYVFPSCGDETNAVGAAYLAQAARRGPMSVPPLSSMYLGPEWTDADIEAALAVQLTDGLFSIERPRSINQAVVQCLVSGEVVARFAGREEFGARSLGNRAIIADPRDPGVIQVINDMIKSRDFWMPFAASVLAETAARYMVNPKTVEAPYMILSFDTTEDGARDLRAGTHPYDRTCRPQVVTQAQNPDYWDLLTRFQQATGVGGVLNTSLNLHGLPLVHRPADAIEVMRKSGLSRLAIGPFLVTKIRSERSAGHTMPGAVAAAALTRPVVMSWPCADTRPSP